MNSIEEKIIINTGLGILFQLIGTNDPMLNKLLSNHPRKDLLTLGNIKKLNEKFKVDKYEL